jgi:protein TonB
MSSRRLLSAYAASLLLHAAILGGGAFKDLLKPPPAAQPLRVVLRPITPMPPAPVEPLLKNTLDPEPEQPREEARPRPPEPAPAKPAPRPAPAEKQPEKKQVQAAQRKLAEHTFYPPEAIARGLEGEVRLIIVLADDGSITDVQVAASSGHAILDNAAIKAAWAMGKLPGATVQQLILPVSFGLR